MFKVEMFYLFVYMCMYDACVWACNPWYMYKVRGQLIRDQFFPTTVWVLGTELRLVLAANTFTH